MKVLKAHNPETGKKLTLFVEKHELKKQGLSVRVAGQWHYLPDTYILDVVDVDADEATVIFNDETLKRYIAESEA